MTYPYGGHGQYPSHSSAPYGPYWPQPAGTANHPTPPQNGLVWAVLLLGLATYVVSLSAGSPPLVADWAVRFSTLAAVGGALNVLTRQRTHNAALAGLATMAFLEALARVITSAPDIGWATIVIAILTALQAATAVAVLLRQPQSRHTAVGRRGAFDNYPDYARVGPQYDTTSHQQPQQPPAHGQATAQAQAAASAQAQQYSLYSEYLSAQRRGPNSPISSVRPAGLAHTAPPTPRAGLPATGPATNIRPGIDPATEAPPQSTP